MQVLAWLVASEAQREHLPGPLPALAAADRARRPLACGQVTPVSASIGTWPLRSASPLFQYGPPSYWARAHALQ